VRWGGGTCRLGSLAVPALVELVQERERERERERKKERKRFLVFWNGNTSSLICFGCVNAWHGMVWYGILVTIYCDAQFSNVSSNLSFLEKKLCSGRIIGICK
jgi:hypothetical protein